MIYYDRDNIVVRDSEQKDIYSIGAWMRQRDKDEIWASHHHTPMEAVSLSFKVSALCLTVDYEGYPIAMFGVVPETLCGDKATVWMLGTEALDDFLTLKNLRFLRYSRRFIKFFLCYYPYLFNWVDSRNTVCKNWLQWCGFKLEEAIPYGVEQLPFHFFHTERG